MKKKVVSQEDKILNYLRTHKSITSMQAFRVFGITRLSGRIFNLRQDGNIIDTERITKKNEDGTYTTYGEYYLLKEAKK